MNLRALRAARQRTRDRLAAAYADDLIDSDELDRRLGELVDATTVEEVEALAADVVEPTDLAVPAPAPTSTALVTLGEVESHAIISAIFGEAQRAGTWIPARFNDVRAIFASTMLDLREARLAPGETIINVNVVFGEVVIVVPPELPVVSEVSVILASLEEDEDEPPSDAETIRIRLTGRVIFGEVHVARRHPGESKRDAKKRRKARRKALKARSVDGSAGVKRGGVGPEGQRSTRNGR